MKKAFLCFLVLLLHGPVNGTGTGIQIFIRLLSGTILTLDVETNDTVESVKQKIGDKLPVPVAKQRLLFGNVLLDNNQTLADYNIQRESTLSLGIDYDPVIYVSKTANGNKTGLSWTDAFTDLQSALLMAQAGDHIWIAADTYYPDEGPSQTNNNRDASFVIPSGVVVYGGFPTSGEPTLTSRNWVTYPTILSGDLMQNDGSDFSGYDDNSYTVLTANYVSSQTELNGLVIRGGNGGETKNGGAVYNNGSGSGKQSTPRFVNCSFIENQARNGAAVFNDGRQGNSSPTFLNCIFRNNKATRDGGALYNFGGYSGNSSPTLTNCLIVSNKALRIAGGIFNDAVDAIGGTSSPTITNCTFALNQADFGAGALYSDGRNGGVSTPAVRNSIVSGAGTQIDNNTATPTISNSITPPTDPLFINAAAGDFRLKACSPGVNAGNNTFNTESTDLTGSNRIQQVTIDMGAYETSSLPLDARITGGGTYCQFGAAPIISFIGSGGTKPYTFTFSFSGLPPVPVSTTGDNDFVAFVGETINETTFSFTLHKVRDANGCEVSFTSNNSITINVVANPILTASSNAPICTGTPLRLSASGGTAWTWNGPNGFSNTSQNPIRSPTTVAMSGVYSVTISTSNGCTQVATTQVQISQLNTPQLSSNSPVCVGSPLRLSVTGTSVNTSYSWEASVPFSSSLQNPIRSNASTSMSGTYSVTVVGACGSVVLTTSVVVSPNVAPSITSLQFNNTLPNAQNTVSVCNTAPVSLNIAATNAVTYSWRGPTGAGSGFTSSLVSPVTMSIATPRQGQYTVSVRNGCTVFNQRVINLQLINCISNTRLASAEAPEMEPEIKLVAYPSPVGNHLNVEVRLPEPQPLQLRLLNMTGQESRQWEMGEASTTHQTQLDLQGLPSGMYLLQAQAGSLRVVKKIVKLAN